MSRSLVFSPEAGADLIQIYDYIAPRGGPDRADAYVARIVTFCRNLTSFPERGTVRNELRPGLRVVGFERRVSVAFRVDEHSVGIVRFLYGGRSLEGAFPPEKPT